jgi:hypothetical protein
LDQTADLALNHLTERLTSWELNLREWQDLPLPADAKVRVPPDATLLRIALPLDVFCHVSSSLCALGDAF